MNTNYNTAYKNNNTRHFRLADIPVDQSNNQIPNKTTNYPRNECNNNHIIF